MFRRTLSPTALRGIRHGSTSSPEQIFRYKILAGAVALITASGALTGAWLKRDRDIVKQKKDFQETSIDSRIAILEDRRSTLVSMKMPVEMKLEGLRTRMRAKKELEEQRGGEGRR
ncbi:hypothetical protein VM1G_10922 [Cytospora mali]|uniref:Uncharacterized protein n=1 Tax=Cytospora mali TaxID=578113 RepID=A0A194VJG3_CYTMA|nr:hypothetical protein VM1G_10922 [Valsa mali]